MPHTPWRDLRAARLAGMTPEERTAYEAKMAKLAADLRAKVAAYNAEHPGEGGGVER